MELRLLFHSFKSRRDWHGNRARPRMHKALKYALRCARRPGRQAAWLGFLDADPSLRRIVATQPRLYERWHHAYINRHLDGDRRLAIVRDHYAFVLSRWPAGVVESIYLGNGLPVGTLQLKDGSVARMELLRPVNKGTEGELGLYLLDAAGRRLGCVVFTFADGGRSLLIGCIQGALAHLGADAVSRFTRQSHGLRPKNLLLSMLYALASHHGATRLFGVGNAAHPFAGQNARNGKGSRIKTDYDAFWQECHGESMDDGFYRLPDSEPPRDVSKVESKHRSAFRRREWLRQAACDLLVEAVGGTRLRDHAGPGALVPMLATA